MIAHPIRFSLFAQLATLAALSIIDAPHTSAAQNAVVTVEQAVIREKPDPEAPPLESRNAGTQLRISQHSKDGWYKVRASDGRYGWVRQGDIAIPSLTDGTEATDLELRQQPRAKRARDDDSHWLFLRAGGNLFFMTAPDLSKRLGQDSGVIHSGFGGFVELAAQLSENYRLALRLGTYSTARDFSRLDPATSEQINYKVESAGVPLLLGIDTDFSRSDAFQLAAGLYAGLGLSATTTVTSDQSAPNSVELSRTSVAALLNISAKWWLSRRFALVGEVGGYYNRISSSEVASLFNGVLDGVVVNHAGLTTGAGIQFAL